MENTQNDTERVNELNYKAGYADGLLMELLEEWLKEHSNDSKRNNAKGLLELLGYLLMKDYA